MEACEPCSRRPEHVHHIRHRRRVPRGDVLVERRRIGVHAIRGTVEHGRHHRHLLDVPCGKILVEFARPFKHVVHIRHRGDVPVGNIGVEITFPLEYIFHIVDSGHVPRSNGDVVRVFAARSRGVGTKTAVCSESGSQSSFRVERGLRVNPDRACENGESDACVDET